jgi:hypothetical protein
MRRTAGMAERFMVDGYEKKPPGMNRAALE